MPSWIAARIMLTHELSYQFCLVLRLPLSRTSHIRTLLQAVIPYWPPTGPHRWQFGSEVSSRQCIAHGLRGLNVRKYNAQVTHLTHDMGSQTKLYNLNWSSVCFLNRKKARGTPHTFVLCKILTFVEVLTVYGIDVGDRIADWIP